MFHIYRKIVYLNHITYNIIIFILLFFSIIKSQENYSYQKPPKEILELVDVTLPPRVLIDENKTFIAGDLSSVENPTFYTQEKGKS